MKPSDDIGASYDFSYTTSAVQHELYENPLISDLNASESIPLDAFSHASAMQAVARYLVDVRRLSFTDAAKLLGRSPKSLWASYHQTATLPELKESIPIPISIFFGKAPLEALVPYLKSLGLRNVEIASLLKLSPKTTWTVAKRAEVKG